MTNSPTSKESSVVYRQQYRRCCKPTCLRCKPGCPGHGPYWYAFWWENGRTRSRYVGKELPANPADVAFGALTLPPLRVRTLGTFAVWRGSTLIPPERWTRRKVVALFKLLLGAPACRLEREEICETLWPEADPAQGAASLRSAARFLRTVLDTRAGGPSYLNNTGSLWMLDPAPGDTPAPDWLDAQAFRSAATDALRQDDRALCRAVLARYQGAYLPDDHYEDWTAAHRQQLQHLHERLQLHLARLARDAADAEEAITALRAVLAADPCQEEAARLLMVTLATGGRQAEALRVYQELQRALRDELAVAPSPETELARTRCMIAVASPPASAVPTNLPASPPRLIGRAAELAALEQALVQRGTALGEPGAAACSQLLSVIGVGGCGKTRLALAAAAHARAHFPDGVWLVELAPLAGSGTDDPTPVVTAILAALGVREQARQRLPAMLIDYLRGRRLLLVLDNCEHLITACAALVSRVVIACPTLQILATSREVLSVAGETVYRLPVLSLPPASDDVLPAQIAGSEAVQLFVERAQASRPGFALTAANARSVAQICRQLDGLPLAIELAAARLQALSVQDIAARLGDRFQLLRRGNRAALPRHQTLQAAMDWSYELLEEPERRLLRRLAVFSGGFTLHAAETVCSDAPGDVESVVDLLSQLVDKSLVVATALDDATNLEDAQPRFCLLETVRQYGLFLLRRHDALVRLRDRHLQWCLQLAKQAEPALTGPDLRPWLLRLEAEHDNVRAALNWSLAAGTGSVERRHMGLALAEVLWRFWWMRGHLREGRRWLDAMLAADPGAPALQRARALLGAGNLASQQSDFERALVLYEKCQALFRDLGDGPGLAATLVSLGRAAHYQGNHALAATRLQEGLVLWRLIGDRRGSAVALGNLATLIWNQGNYAHARALREESLALFEEVGDHRSVAFALGSLARVERSQGNVAQAEVLWQRSLGQFFDLGVLEDMCECLDGLASVALAGDRRRAAPLRAAQRAAVLFGGAAALREKTGAQLLPAHHLARKREMAIARQTLGDSAFAAAWQNGREMRLDLVVALALQCAASASPA